MLHLFSGSDREKARGALNLALGKAAKKKAVVRITDAHTPADLSAVLQGPGMFGDARVIALDAVIGGGNAEMRMIALAALEAMRDSGEEFFMLEGALDADTRKKIEKYAENAEKFDAPKKEKDNAIFALANALQRGDKKELWVGYQRELAKGSAPEAIHGLLFWGAKRMLMSGGGDRARSLVAKLAELPHEARRRGEDMEYALERFVLSGA